MRSQISAPIEPPPPVTTIDAALDEILQPPVVDLHARPQQQVFDIDRREAQRLHAVVERRQAAGGKPEPARPHQQRVGRHIRLEGRRRQHDAPHIGAAIGKIGHHAFEIVEIAEHRNAADRLALIGGDGDSTPTGQVFFTAPLSIARSSTSASAARPRIRIGAEFVAGAPAARARE